MPRRRKRVELPAKQTIFSVLNQKGGVGKSTTAVHLTQWIAERAGKENVTLLDTDAQQSSSTWLRGSGIPSLSIQDADEIWEYLLTRDNQSQYTVVDGAGGITTACQNTLLSCDIAIFPVQPSSLDINSSRAILQTLKKVRLQRGNRGEPFASIFLSRTKSTSLMTGEAMELLEQQDAARVIPVTVPERVILQRIPADHLTVWDLADPASKELQSVYTKLFHEILHYYNSPDHADD